jgi:hypothetical protein
MSKSPGAMVGDVAGLAVVIDHADNGLGLGVAVEADHEISGLGGQA